MGKFKITGYKYTLIRFDDGKIIGRANDMDSLAAVLGCTKQHIYREINSKQRFSYKKIIYQII